MELAYTSNSVNTTLSAQVKLTRFGLLEKPTTHWIAIMANNHTCTSLEPTWNIQTRRETERTREGAWPSVDK